MAAASSGLGGDCDGAPTIIFEGGIDFPHPGKPPIIVDPGPKKPPFRSIVGHLPVSVLDLVTNPGNGGGNGGGNVGNGGGTTTCFIGKPCHQQP